MDHRRRARWEHERPRPRHRRSHRREPARTTAELEDFLGTLRQAPRDVGTLDLVVARPSEGERSVLDEGQLDLLVGLVGDTWAASRQLAHRRRLLAPRHAAQRHERPDGGLPRRGAPERRALAGDQLYVDLDLSHENLPTGTTLTIGDPAARGAVIEVTDQPHRGCAKFIDRFGGEAMRFVNGRVGTVPAAAWAQRQGGGAGQDPARRPGHRVPPAVTPQVARLASVARAPGVSRCRGIQS